MTPVIINYPKRRHLLVEPRHCADGRAVEAQETTRKLHGGQEECEARWKTLNSLQSCSLGEVEARKEDVFTSVFM